jgi:hypothetical protein
MGQQGALQWRPTHPTDLAGHLLSSPLSLVELQGACKCIVETNQLVPRTSQSSEPAKSSLATSLCPSGCRSRTAVAPLERLKILMQVQGNERVYRSTWQGLVHMAKTEGIRVRHAYRATQHSFPSVMAARVLLSARWCMGDSAAILCTFCNQSAGHVQGEWCQLSAHHPQLSRQVLHI